MKTKKGQVQLGETTAVIIIVIIIMIFGIVFWNKANSSNVNNIAAQSQELSVIEIANIISEFPELKCYESSASRVKCMDWYKILAMNATINNNNPNDRRAFEFYNNYFKNSKITIVKVYPVEENVTIYDAKLANSTRSLLIPIPINIKNYVTNEVSYGMIIVEGYYKGT